MPKSKNKDKASVSSSSKHHRPISIAHQKKGNQTKGQGKQQKLHPKLKIDKNPFTVICLDESSQKLDNPVKKIKQDNYTKQTTQTKPKATTTKLFQSHTNSISPLLQQHKKQRGDDDEPNVLQINHLFKSNDDIYLEVMVGNSQGKMYREPQFMTYHSLQNNPHTKMLLYTYMVKFLCEYGKNNTNYRRQ